MVQRCWWQQMHRGGPQPAAAACEERQSATLLCWLPQPLLPIQQHCWQAATAAHSSTPQPSRTASVPALEATGWLQLGVAVLHGPAVLRMARLCCMARLLRPRPRRLHCCSTCTAAHARPTTSCLHRPSLPAAVQHKRASRRNTGAPSRHSRPPAGHRWQWRPWRGRQQRTAPPRCPRQRRCRGGGSEGGAAGR